MTKEMHSEFENTISTLEQLLHSFNQSALNTVPFEGSWTAAQVAEHVTKSQSMGTELLYGRTNTTARNPYEKKEAIKKLFLDFTIKMTSPEVILPSDKVQEKTELIGNLTAAAGKVTEAIQTLNLSAVCLDFSLPGFGEMTRAEWIYFMIYHTQRHIHQLENISQKLFSGTTVSNN